MIVGGLITVSFVPEPVETSRSARKARLGSGGVLSVTGTYTRPLSAAQRITAASFFHAPAASLRASLMAWMWASYSLQANTRAMASVQEPASSPDVSPQSNRRCRRCSRCIHCGGRHQTQPPSQCDREVHIGAGCIVSDGGVSVKIRFQESNRYNRYNRKSLVRAVVRFAGLGGGRATRYRA